MHRFRLIDFIMFLEIMNKPMVNKHFCNWIKTTYGLFSMGNWIYTRNTPFYVSQMSVYVKDMVNLF